MTRNIYSIVEVNFESLDRDINSCAYRGYRGISPTDGWGGAGIGFSTIPISSKYQSFYSDHRIVVTPHAHAAGWLLDKLCAIFTEEQLIDCCSKIEFFGRLANAAFRYQKSIYGESETAKGLLMSILKEAKTIITEMRQGQFECLPVAAGNSIADDFGKLYFAYGSNMDAKQMEERCPGAELVGEALLEGYGFAINERGVATVVANAEKLVIGLVWVITRTHESTLDEKEGVRYGTYTKKNMAVQMHNDDVCNALVYIAKNSQQGKPRHGYLEKVVAALRNNNVSDKYIEEVSSWF